MSICSQLTHIECHAEEEDKIVVLLKSLPKEYKQIVTVLKEKDPIPSLESVINSLQEEEKKLCKEGAISSSTQDSGAYVVSHKKFLRCPHCGKDNHLASKCFKVTPCTKCGKVGHPPHRCYSTKGEPRRKGNINLVSNESNISYIEPSTSNDDSYDDIL